MDEVYTDESFCSTFLGRKVEKNMKNNYEKVYSLVRKIPKGKVTTYGAIGKKLHMSPRVIGQALHNNPYEGDVPCHRVVNKEGRIAPNFAFGGRDIQRKLLEAEGVQFKDPLFVKDKLIDI